MSRTKEWLEDLNEQERAAWEASPEGQEEMERWTREREAAEAAQARREKVWALRHPDEWEEWLRVQPLLKAVIDFGAHHQFDFEDFLKEVGRRPSANHFVSRVDESLPYQQGNLAWVARTPESPRSPYLNVNEAAAYLGVAVQTIYNNRKHIPALPGFRTLMFDRKALDEVRASPRFMSKRLSKYLRPAAVSLTGTR